MSFRVYVAGIAAFACSWALTWWVRKFAIRHRMIDTPNIRSSHSTPVPRGGGLAVVVASSASVAALTAVGILDARLALAILGGGLPVAWIGFKDDRGSVSARLRLCVHALAAVWTMYVLGGLPPLQVGERIFDLGVAGDVLGTLAIVWTLNLFNFMDGIDGIAASEAVIVAGFGGGICAVISGTLAVPAGSLTLAAASAGFLLWNWPAAKIFMGDVGSGYLGFEIAVLAIASGRDSPVAPFVWLILGAVFFADSLVTLIRRLARGERIYEAHRSHAYQVLARRWSHRTVTIAVILTNLLVLIPLAWTAATHPAWAAAITGSVLVVLAVAVLVLGKERDNGQL